MEARPGYAPFRRQDRREDEYKRDHSKAKVTGSFSLLGMFSSNFSFEEVVSGTRNDSPFSNSLFPLGDTLC